MPPEQQQLYQLPTGGETFVQRRARTERQQTLFLKPKQPSYGPQRPAEPRETPYSGKPPSTDDNINATLDIDIVKEAGHPAGWILEKRMIAMDEVKDEWKLEGNYITRKHYLPRNSGYKPEEDTCIIKMGTQLVRDKWSRPSKNKKLCSGWWTGYTRFRICFFGEKMPNAYSWKRARARRQCTTTKPNPTAMPPCQRGQCLWPIAFPSWRQRRRNLRASSKIRFGSLMMQPMPQQTECWRQGSSWPGSNMRMEPQEPKPNLWRKDFEILTLTWATCPLRHQHWRGCQRTTSWAWPRCGAWPSSLTSSLSPSAPSGWRFPEMAKNYLDSLGLVPGHGKHLKLIKPMYGFCAAPKAWYEEATTRIPNMGKGSIVQHPLDACLFLAFDRQVHPPPPEGAEAPRLIALFGVHVDDIFGCYYENDQHTTVLLQGILTSENGSPPMTRRSWNTVAPRSQRWGRIIGRSIMRSSLTSRSRSPTPRSDMGPTVKSRTARILPWGVWLEPYSGRRHRPAHTCSVWYLTLRVRYPRRLRPPWTLPISAWNLPSRTTTLAWNFDILGPRRRSPSSPTLMRHLHHVMTSPVKEGTWWQWHTEMSPKVEKDTTTSSTGGAGSWHEWREAHLQQRARQHPMLPMRFCLHLRFGDFYGNLGCPWTTSRPPNMPTRQSWLLMPRRCMTCWSETKSKQEAVPTNALPLRF